MLAIFFSIFIFSLNLELVEKERVQEEPFLRSAGSKFLYQVEYSSEGIGEVPIKRFSIYDKEKNLLWQKENPQEEAFFVSDAGWVVGLFGSHPKARLTFYDIKGKRVHQEEIDYPYGYSFSKTGNLFYANTSKGILGFNSQGKVVRNFGYGGHFFPSPDDKFFAVIKEESLKIFKEGKPYGRFAPAQVSAKFLLGSLLFRDLAFSPKGEFLAVCEKHSLSLYSLRDSSLLWRKEFDFATSLLKVIVDDNGVAYLGGEMTDNKRSGFLAVFKDGEEIVRTDIPYFANYETIVGISLDFPFLSVRTTDYHFRFRVREE